MRADLALIGYGNVGRRFAQLLVERREILQREYRLEPRIIGIATRRHGSLFVPDGIDPAVANARLRTAPDSTLTPLELIRRLAASDAELRVVIETTSLDIADGQPAIGHIEAAIAASCHAVTANKGPVAFACRRLRQLADARGVSFLFEGAVMDGVPIFNLVRETMPGVVISGFRGVVNSTTNHILTALENGEPFDPALARMQAEGIAEADASLDVDGWDAAAKTAALANVFLDAGITPHHVRRAGIGSNSGPVARAARAQGLHLRLVAEAARSPDGSVAASVTPQALPPEDLLSHVHGKANALILQTDLLGDIAIHQLGGDLTMTAYALLSDLVTIGRRG